MIRPQLILPFLFSITMLQAQSAREIVQKADEKLRGKSSIMEMKMTIVRPTWTREVELKSWSLGDNYALMYILAPSRDRGVVFLKRDKEIWNWQPSIERMIKLPPSMMMQSWMGSDFKNDDMVRQSSIVNDFSQEIVGNETIDGRECYKIELIPKESAAVVWGKVILWIDKKDYLELKSEFYDEDGYLIHTMYGKSIKVMDNVLLPSVLEVIPADDPGNKTLVEYVSVDFDVPLNEDFFSVQQAKRIKP
ncbi:MAG: outer membrane lipoprotein-sorting protein [Saprospiraceae bacterium]|nr:outer membrane lipoprotein-sorting protein [Saprospiraceae bacterium]